MTYVLKNDIYLAAQKTGFPLDRLHQFEAPEPSVAPELIISTFLDKSTATRQWKLKVKRFWNNFTPFIADCQTIRQITQQHITAYFDSINDNNKLSGTSKKHRLNAIRAVFSFAQSRGINPKDCKEILVYCSTFSQVKQDTDTNPTPISKADFQALLTVAKGKWKAFLLVCLNCCMYGSEAVAIRKDEIDLAKGTLVTRRRKTRKIRAAVLWPETIKAITPLMAGQSPHLFVSREGLPYSSAMLRKMFAKLRSTAGLSDTLTLPSLRDGAYTAAIAGGADYLHAKLLAGHSTGMTDSYVKANRDMVIDASDAIHKHYFG